MKNNFLYAFPAPDFLRMPSVGIDVSDGSIRYVELKEKRGEKILSRYGRIKIPSGVVEKGEIKDKITFLNLLKKIKKENGFDFVRISVVEKKSFIFKTEISYRKGMSRKEVLASLNFKIEENVPLSSNEIIFDFDIVNIKGDKLEAIVTVLPRKIVNDFVEVFGRAGFTPLSLEVEAQAVARSVIMKENKNTFMIVDFRSNRANISIVSEGFVQLTSTLDIGGQDLLNAIQKHEDVNLEKAKEIKEKKGFKRMGSDDDLFYAMMAPIAILKDEINKYLVYWNKQNEAKIKEGDVNCKVKKIFLCGRNGALRSLDDYLSLSLGINVEKSYVWKNLFDLNNFVPTMNFYESLEYAASVGLAMRDNKDIVEKKYI